MTNTLSNHTGSNEQPAEQDQGTDHGPQTEEDYPGAMSTNPIFRGMAEAAEDSHQAEETNQSNSD